MIPAAAFTVEVTLLYAREAESPEGADVLSRLLIEIARLRAIPGLDAVSSLNYSSNATENLGKEIGTSSRTMEEGIMRYVQLKDRYLALASVLLKSRAFHETYSRHNEQCKTLPLVELPRTKHNKPFIPTTNVRNGASEQLAEEDIHPLSISHQYPFAGMARLRGTTAPVKATSVPKTSATRRNQQLLIGFDVVVFDKVNSNLYSTVQEFVDVFRDCFAPSEWTALNNDEICLDADWQLRELYLRWAVKEAYTKALGVGMGFAFSSFETQFANLNEHSLWMWITKGLPIQSTLQAVATVRQLSSSLNPCQFGSTTRPYEENWLFYFLPLFENNTNSRRPQDVIACGVVCVGPLSSNAESNLDPSLVVQWTSISDLISWHVAPTR